MAASLDPRSITSDFDGFKTTFSSWDTCMAKAYCKWPVIAAIIVASLLLLLLVSSIVRCLCCGVECCFACFSCCNACCPSPRSRPARDTTKYAPANQPPPQYPYFPQAGMNYGAPPPAAPQFASFDAPSWSKNGGAAVHEDALPNMPSWDTAQRRRVMSDDEDNLDTAYHGATGEQENGDIALGGMMHPRAQDYEQRQPMLQQHAIPPTYNDEPSSYNGTSSSSYPYQTQNAYAGGDLGGYPAAHHPLQQQQEPTRYASGHSAVPPSYRSQQTSPAPYAQGYPQNAGGIDHHVASPSSYNQQYQPNADLFYPTPTARYDAPLARRPVGGGGNNTGPEWM